MDNQLFTQIYSLYYKDIYRFIYSYLRDDDKTQDVIQEAFIKLFQDGPKDENKCKSWLLSVSKNLSLDLLRKEKREREYVSTLKENTASYDSSYIDLYENLDKIPDKYSKVIRMYYFANMSAKEIGKALLITESVARKRLQRGKEKLREIMEG